MKDVVLDAVRQQLAGFADDQPTDEPYVPTGRLKCAEHVIGSFDGPTDLSTNPTWMEEHGN